MTGFEIFSAYSCKCFTLMISLSVGVKHVIFRFV